MRLALLPARGGSKRIKNKNIIDFSGRPMISYPLRAVQLSEVFDTIHVSTEDDRIAKIAAELGFPVDFKRPAELADDFTPTMDVVRYVLKTYEGLGKIFESVAIIMPCSPLIEADDLRKAVSLFDKSGKDCPVLSVTTFPAPVEWSFEKDKHGRLTACFPNFLDKRSQDLGQKFYDTGSFCIQSVKAVMNPDLIVPTQFIGFEIPRSRAVDIDTPEDLEFAKRIYSALQ